MDRLLLSLGLVLVCVLAAAGLWLGWRSRRRRQLDDLKVPTPPAVPADLGAELAEPLTGLYVSTTTSGSWQDRLVAHGLGRRARSRVRLTTAGILIDRIGELPIFVPANGIRKIGTAPGIAGKVMGMPDGVLIITWMLGDLAVDTGIRADDLELQDSWIDAATDSTTDSGATS